METSGYKAARAEAMTLFGPSDARIAMRYAAKVNCRLLLSPRYSEAGVSQRDREWKIILAQPLLDPNLRGWQEAGREVLKLVNTARARGHKCGNRHRRCSGTQSWAKWPSRTASIWLNITTSAIKAAMAEGQDPVQKQKAMLGAALGRTLQLDRVLPNRWLRTGFQAPDIAPTS
jgi:hypothetical protein